MQLGKRILVLLLVLNIFVLVVIQGLVCGNVDVKKVSTQLAYSTIQYFQKDNISVYFDMSKGWDCAPTTSIFNCRLKPERRGGSLYVLHVYFPVLELWAEDIRTTTFLYKPRTHTAIPFLIMRALVLEKTKRSRAFKTS